MTAIQGYFKNNVFINESNIPIPEEQPVTITVLENRPMNTEAESKRQKAIFSEFYVAIQANSEELGEKFDKTLADRPKFHEIDI